MGNHLTPLQVDRLSDGWHTAIVLGMGDFDTLHAFLMCPDCDAGGGRELWDRIYQQVTSRHFLNRVARQMDGAAD